MQTTKDLGKFLGEKLGLDEDDVESFEWTKISAADVHGKSIEELTYLMVVSRMPRELARRIAEALVAALGSGGAPPHVAKEAAREGGQERWPLAEVRSFVGRAAPLVVPAGLGEAIGALQAARGVEARAERLGFLLQLLDGEVAEARGARLVGEHGEYLAAGLCRFAPGAKRAWEGLVWMGLAVPALRDVTEQCAAAVQWEVAARRLLEHQPGRTACVGLLCDGRRACFVRAECNPPRLLASEAVTLFAPADGAGGEGEDGGRQWQLAADGELLLRFLALSPEQAEYVAAELPVVLGVQMESCLRRGARAANAIYLAGGRVYKVGSSAAWEVQVMDELRRGCCLKVCPAATGPSGGGAFSMELCDELRARCREATIEVLAASLFWKLYEMHECGVIHADVKPSNVLWDRDGEFIFTDFDATVKWLPGQPEPARTRFTKDFAEATSIAVVSPRDWDLEGLFWTLVYVWARQQNPPSAAWDESVRQNLAAEAAASWGPLQHYFRSTLREKQLLHPAACMAKYAKAKAADSSFEAWRDAVRAIEGRKCWLPCPEKLLRKTYASRK